MKKLLLIITLVFASMPLLWAQSPIEDSFLHDLRGMEDHSGKTHLFYRHFQKEMHQCSYTDHNQDTTYVDQALQKNNIYHYDVNASTDSIRFQDYDSPRPECDIMRQRVLNYSFYDKQINKAFQHRALFGTLTAPYIMDWRGNSLSPGFTAPATIAIDSVRGELLIPTSLEYVVVKSTDDQPNLRSTYRIGLQREDWNQYDIYNELPDSLLFDFTILAVNPNSNNEYFAVREDSLFQSLDHGDSLVFIKQHGLFSDASADLLFNSSDEEIYYFIFRTEYSQPQSIRTVKKLYFSDDQWIFEPVMPDDDIRAITIDHSKSGNLYIADSLNVYASHNNAETFSQILTFNSTITGLYKKPGSELLYALTKEELLEVNVRTGESTSLNQLAVSNEPVTHAIPATIKLYQNYPNPFNPTTQIRFSLPEQSQVSLVVYDMLGREVARLVDGLLPAGEQTVRFDASNLANGVYLYRLQANQEKQVRMMTLIK